MSGLEDKNLTVSGDRISRGRLEGGIVPAPLSSSSRDGQLYKGKERDTTDHRGTWAGTGTLNTTYGSEEGNLYSNTLQSRGVSDLLEFNCGGTENSTISGIELGKEHSTSGYSTTGGKWDNVRTETKTEAASPSADKFLEITLKEEELLFPPNNKG